MGEYVIIFTILTVISYAYLKVATKYKITDTPNKRSSHTKITIRGGGIIFPIALGFFFFLNDYQYPYLFIGVSLIALLSFIDDLKPLPPGLRLPFQFIAAVLVFIELGDIFPWLAMGLLLIVAVGFINAFNFMDGINGITGFYTLAVLGFLSYFNSFIEEFVHPDLLFFILMSVVVFGFYNFRKKALFFAGDVGSISLAVIFLFVVLKFYYHFTAPVAILLVSVYGVDTVMTIMRRIFMKEKITEAHRHHLYQLFVDSKRHSHIAISMYYFMVQLIMCAVVYYTFELPVIKQLLVSVSSLIILAAIYLLLVCNFLQLRSAKSF
jgi:UDP-N-acetylmuramyl pentapeptide phosphotransferase/UDP-N-acetylglucosamine-1-phosphate transferase